MLCSVVFFSLLIIFFLLNIYLCIFLQLLKQLFIVKDKMIRQVTSYKAVTIQESQKLLLSFLNRGNKK